MAYGDDSDGTLFLYEVPLNLKTAQENEYTTIDNFWNREIDKCNDVKERRAIRKEMWQE